MVVVPASTAAVAGIAIGLSKDLLQRAADVTLKERRPFVIVPREAPYTRATLQHLLTLHDSGASCCPPAPASTARRPRCSSSSTSSRRRVLDAIGVDHDLITRWTGELGAARRGDLDDQPRGPVDFSRGRRRPPTARRAARQCAARPTPSWLGWWG
jgi:4-hydroxy-3-polyprenylbenzoate decarboxylase